MPACMQLLLSCVSMAAATSYFLLLHSTSCCGKVQGFHTSSEHYCSQLAQQQLASHVHHMCTTCCSTPYVSQQQIKSSTTAFSEMLSGTECSRGSACSDGSLVVMISMQLPSWGLRLLHGELPEPRAPRPAACGSLQPHPSLHAQVTSVSAASHWPVQASGHAPCNRAHPSLQLCGIHFAARQPAVTANTELLRLDAVKTCYEDCSSIMAGFASGQYCFTRDISLLM